MPNISTIAVIYWNLHQTNTLYYVDTTAFFKGAPLTSDFVTPASCIPDALKSQKMQNNSWHASHRSQRLIDQSEDVEYPVCVISVTVV